MLLRFYVCSPGLDSEICRVRSQTDYDQNYCSAKVLKVDMDVYCDSQPLISFDRNTRVKLKKHKKWKNVTTLRWIARCLRFYHYAPPLDINSSSCSLKKKRAIIVFLKFEGAKPSVLPSNSSETTPNIFSCFGAHIPAFFGHVTLSCLFLSRHCKSNMEARRHNYRIQNAS